MFFIMYGSNTIANSTATMAPYTETIRKIFGVLMILGALAIASHFDVVLQQFALKYFPMITVGDNPIVQKELEKLSNDLKITSPAPTIGSPAPDFIGITDWINSEPLTIKQLRGKVVLVDFWTYSCINCVRTLPYLKQWYNTYNDNGFVVVGVHTPEFEFEKNLANVNDAVKRFEIHYPVALDNNYATWRNYHNRYWPAHFIIDRNGIIQYIHFGEGEYLKTENTIRSLLGLSPKIKEEEKEKPLLALGQTPETYLGYSRAQRYTPQITLKQDKTAEYNFQGILADDQVGLNGTWFVAGEYIKSESDDAALMINFLANRVYLVMASENPAAITILLDGKPLQEKYFTADVHDKAQLLVKDSRMYDILNLKGDNGRHTLTLQVPKNVLLYAFTFGSGTQ